MQQESQRIKRYLATAGYVLMIGPILSVMCIVVFIMMVGPTQNINALPIFGVLAINTGMLLLGYRILVVEVWVQR